MFDVTRKPTYKNLAIWYKELREYREDIPCILVANKIDGNSMSIPHLMKKNFPAGVTHSCSFVGVSQGRQDLH